VSGDALNLLLAAAGIISSAVLSVVFYRLGTRAADAQKAELLEELDGLRKMLANVVQRVAGRDAAPVRAPGATGPPTTGGGVALEGKDPDSAVELLVLASLGALLNERGEVSLPRLLREVGEALRRPSYQQVVAVLRRLRDEGSVDWDGATDLAGVEVVRVRPPRRETVK
jgi:hypothetical protein